MAISADRFAIPSEYLKRLLRLVQGYGRGWSRQKIMADGFRLTAFGAAIFQIIAFPNGPTPYNAFPDAFISGSKAYPYGPGYTAAGLTGLVMAAGIYSLLKIAQPFKWHQVRTINASLLAVDIIASVLLVNLSGGIHSPFVLYTLVPVLTAALVKDYTATVLVSCVTGAYVLTGNIYNSASNYVFTLQAVNDFFVYLIALSLVAILPYAINLTEGRKLQSSAAARERGRISRDLHDSVCQSLCGLRWQVQSLSKHLPADNQLSDELNRIEKAVKTAEQDARILLEVLCTLNPNGGFLPSMKYHLEQLKHYAGVNYQLEWDGADIELEEPVERELSMICIEALTNIKKHAGAGNVLFSVKKANANVHIRIADDGSGFEGASESTYEAHGLSIMRQRANSIGGTMRVTSAIGKGTEIEVELMCGGGGVVDDA